MSLATLIKKLQEIMRKDSIFLSQGEAMFLPEALQKLYRNFTEKGGDSYTSQKAKNHQFHNADCCRYS